MKVCLGAIHLLNLFLIHVDGQVTSTETLNVVDPNGLEPSTFAMSMRRSNQN